MKLAAPLKYQISFGDRRIKYQIFLFILFTIYYLLFNIPSALAAQPNTQNPYIAPNTNSDVPKNLHTYTQNVIIEIMSAITCQLTGIDPVNPNQQCLGVDNKTGKIGFVPSNEAGGGAIGVMGKMISVLYTPPLHTGDYFNHLAQNFGIAKKAYAQQGTGFEGLKPLLGLWTAFRNIVYLIFTIVFVVIGLAIMFRIKIDPRTVMTIQNQIPKIIVGIVLVTFSYAIAGFLIDMMYTSIYLIGNVITSADKEAPGNLVTEMAQTHNPLQAAALIEHQPSGVWTTFLGLPQIAWKPAETAREFIVPLFDNPPGRIITGIVGYQLFRFIEQSSPVKGVLEKIKIGTKTGAALLGTGLGSLGGPPGTVIGSVIGKTVGELAAGLIGAGIGAAFGPLIISHLFSIIAFLIILIAILWSLFRLWFTLIMAYIYILIDVVFAPFWIAGGIIPGQPVTFGGWLRHILSYIAAFPTTIALFLLGKVFIDAFGTDQKGFVPPLIGNPTDTNAIGAIIGLGIILMSSNVVNITTKLFKAPQVDFGRIGQALGAGTGVVSSPLTAAKQLGTGAFTMALSQRLAGRLPSWLPGGGGRQGGGGGGS